MKFISSVLIVLLLFPFIGNTQIEFNKQTEQKIDALFEEFKNEPGAAVGVFANGKTLYQKGFGYANLENEIKITPQSVFEVGSVGMHVTATAILLLEKEGMLSLDDPIQKHLTEFAQYKKGKVTIRHCFHHSSGLRDYMDLLKFSGKSKDMVFDNKAAFDLLQKQKELTIVPGSDYRYSYSNYMVLALIVERISGKSLGEFAKQKIFNPLGMTNTFFYEDRKQVIKNRALLYGKEDDKLKLKQNYQFTACGDGRLYSTIEDMMKWSENFGNSKIGGDAKFMEKLFIRGKLNNGETMSYALGLEHGDMSGHRLIAHNGWWGGATAMFVHFPEKNIFVMTMGNNADKYVFGKAYDVGRILLKAEKKSKDVASKPILTAKTSKGKISKKEKEKICGSYFSYKIGYARKVYLKDNDLYFSDGENEDAKLALQDDGRFLLMDGKNRSRFRFDKKGNDRIMYFHYGERPPMDLLAFEPAGYSENELNKFTGKYHSKELDITYDLKIEDKKLKIYIGEEKLVEYNPLMANLFNSDHDGYVKFENGANGKVSKFTINDYSLGNLSFFKQ